jgi:transcriptional regulator with XRE-family HTH domain
MESKILEQVRDTDFPPIVVEVPLWMVPEDELFRPHGLVSLSTMPASLRKIVAQRIEQAIVAAGFNRQDLFASEIGMSRGTLSRVLSSSVDLRLSTVERIAEGLGISPHLLLLPDPIPGLPSATSPSTLKRPGRSKDPEILVKVHLPAGLEPPDWLKAACSPEKTPAHRIEVVTEAPKPVKAKKGSTRTTTKPRKP